MKPPMKRNGNRANGISVDSRLDKARSEIETAAKLIEEAAFSIALDVRATTIARLIELSAELQKIKFEKL